MVNEFKPHIVHLTGHGAVQGGEGRFAFEKEDGTADHVSSTELRRFLAGSGVQCVFVSGCKSGKAPREALAGICQGLVGWEVPLAVGWAASIADDLATSFARTFYRTLKSGQPVDRALLLACQEAWTACEKRDDPSWTLPVIYSATDQVQIFDPKKPPETLNRRNEILAALPGMKEGYAEHFVGRRREQQRLLPALRNGDMQVVIITGLGGSGKSTLATRLAHKLETGGFTIIPVPSSRENPLSSARLLQAFSDAFRQEARKIRAVNAQKADELSAIAEDLNNPRLSVQSRLRDAVAALNEGRFLLLLDNFESNIDEADRHILDPELSKFYRHLLYYLSGSSRAIITTRYPPSDVPVLPSKVHKEDLGDFPESFFLKIMQRDPEVERRIRSGELPMPLMTELHKKFGGTPRFLIQMREAVKEMDAELLVAELARAELPVDTEQGELERLRDEYFGGIFIDRLFGYLRLESQKALCRAAVYGVPATMEGLAAVAGVPLNDADAFARSWQDRAFAYQETGKSKEPLWIVYSLLRGWLLAKLSPEERTDAHKAAGDFLYRLLKQGTETSLGLHWTDCLLEARNHYINGEDLNKARDATNTLSTYYLNTGNYKNSIDLHNEINRYGEYPYSMIRVAQSYLNMGNLSEAINHFEKALSLIGNPTSYEGAAAIYGLAQVERIKGNHAIAREKLLDVIGISKQINDTSIEASALQELAIIDHDQGNLDDALKKFTQEIEIKNKINKINKYSDPSLLHNIGSIYLGKKEYDKSLDYFLEALKIEQQKGDKHGEGMTFSLLAMVALWLNKSECCLRLSILSTIILKSIGHYYLPKVEFIIKDLSGHLNLTPNQLDEKMMMISESYKKDRGWGLISMAFNRSR
jgi:tetratricopeptide (TPR) repeat protein